MVDPKELLIKYIDHVAQCEGAPFLEDIDFKNSSGRVHFSKEEIDTLRLLASQIGLMKDQ